MFILGNFFEAVAQLLNIAITLYIWVVIIRALLSWVNPDPYNPIVRFLQSITDPVLFRIRSFLPSMAGIDLSPVVLILALYFIKAFLVQTFFDLAQALH